MALGGRLYVIEGGDGTGKTALAQAVSDHLDSVCHPHKYLAFPGQETGTFGRHVYELHHDGGRFGVCSIHAASLQLLHVAAHVDTIERTIKPALAAGCSIVLDRFWWSAWVYGAADGVDPGVLDIILSVEQKYWGDILPDVAFLLDRDLPLRNAEPSDRWLRVRDAYRTFVDAGSHPHPVRIIANASSLDDALARVLSALERLEAAPEGVQVADPRRTGQLAMPFTAPNAPLTVIATPTDSRNATGRHQGGGRTILAPIAPAKTTEVFDTYWRFAAERQRIFFRRLTGEPPPWTNDPILATYKFTNAYRASDRVSQYLINSVIRQGEQEPDELFFRIMLFKMFNSVATWELLRAAFGTVTREDYSFDRYDTVLSKALDDGTAIFSAAYLMPPGGQHFGYARKHRNYLCLLEIMMADDVPRRLTEARSMREAYELLLSYPMIGPFLAYQYVTDLNYSTLTNFSEMEFVMPGPGARDGIRKCFTDLGGLSEIDIIQVMAQRQDGEFDRLGLDFQSLWGRPLQLIDCQNLFCEVDKYARVAHPQIKGISGRQRIKQLYRQAVGPLDVSYPPKWGLSPTDNQANCKDNDA